METGDKPQDSRWGRDPRQDSNPVVGTSYRPAVNPGAVEEGMLNKPQDGQRGRDSRQDSNPVGEPSHRPAVNPRAEDGQQGRDPRQDSNPVVGMSHEPAVNPKAEVSQQGRDLRQDFNPVVGTSYRPAVNPGAVEEGMSSKPQDSQWGRDPRQDSNLEVGPSLRPTVNPGAVDEGVLIQLWEAIHALTQSNAAVQSLMLEVIRRLSAPAEGGTGTARTVGGSGSTHPVEQESVPIGLPSAVTATPDAVGQVLRTADDGINRVARKRSVSQISVGGGETKPNKRKRPWVCKNCGKAHGGRCPEPMRCYNCGKVGHKRQDCTEPVGNRGKRRK